MLSILNAQRLPASAAPDMSSSLPARTWTLKPRLRASLACRPQTEISSHGALVGVNGRPRLSAEKDHAMGAVSVVDSGARGFAGFTVKGIPPRGGCG